MEIIVATIKDLNRYLNLGLYILLDSERICLMSLSLGSVMKSFPATTSLELFNYLSELKRQITFWDLNRCLGRFQTSYKIRNDIKVHYRFDIDKHFKYPKYGTE